MVRPVEVQEAESLAELAALANAKHAEGAAVARRSIAEFRAAGDALLKAKAKVRHGEWLGWLKKNIRFSGRTARNYIRIAENWDQIGSAANLDDGIRGAMRLLGMDSDEQEKEIPEATQLPMPEEVAADDPPAPADEEDADDGPEYVGYVAPAGDPERPRTSLRSAAQWTREAGDWVRKVEQVRDELSTLIATGFRPLVERAASHGAYLRLGRTGQQVVIGTVAGVVTMGPPQYTNAAFDDLLHMLTSLRDALGRADDLPTPDSPGFLEPAEPDEVEL